MIVESLLHYQLIVDIYCYRYYIFIIFNTFFSSCYLIKLCQILKLQSCQNYNCHNYFVFSQCDALVRRSKLQRLVKRRQRNWKLSLIMLIHLRIIFTRVTWFVSKIRKEITINGFLNYFSNSLYCNKINLNKFKLHKQNTWHNK